MIDILSVIKKEKLNGLTKSKLIKQLSEHVSVSGDEINREIETLLESGDLVFVKKNQISTYEYAGLLKGSISGTSKGYAFFEPNDENIDDIFIAPTKLNGALNQDIVLVKVLNKNQEKKECEVVKIISRGVQNIVGTIEVYKNFAFVICDNKRFGKDVFINSKHLNGAKHGDKVYVKILSYDKKNPEGKVIEILGKSEGDINADVMSIVRSYDLIEEFDKKVLNEAKSIPQVVPENMKKNRTDLRDLITFTIDGDDSRDFDDAVSLTKENGIYHLGVHIADVGEYVKYNSNLDKEAYKRATSVYFPNMVLPMLPVELSNGICSLNPNVDRLTLSVFMDIDQNGKVVSHNICESVINSNERMTYGNVTKILEGDEALNKKYEKIVPTLKLMEELNSILENVREARGALDFEIPEPKIIVDPEKMEIVKFEKKPRTVSERLIESFMLIANETVAEHFVKLKLPFVYRVHEKPDADKMNGFKEYVAGLGLSFDVQNSKLTSKDLQNFLNQIEDLEYKDVINKVLLRSLQKAKYAPLCLGHFGLSAKFYCHFTSPIRRYPDLTIHRIIKMFLRNKIDDKVKSTLSNFVDDASVQSSEREVVAQRAERDVDDYFKARYMLDKIGEEFEGKISGVTSFGIFVELENTIEGLVSIESLPESDLIFDEAHYKLSNSQATYKLGDKIKVKVASVHLAERNIDFVLAK